MISAVQRSGKRRQSRRPAGFLMVQVEEGGLDRVVTGQLVDTSKGGLGLALDSPLAEGSRVIVTRGAHEAEGEGAHRWERREGRVAYAAPAQDGVYRVGLAFKPEAPARLELWGTRALLLGVLGFVAQIPITSGRAPTVLEWVSMVGILALAAAVEWHHWVLRREYREACARWDMPEVVETANGVVTPLRQIPAPGPSVKAA